MSEEPTKQRVLFVCMHNAARSQMAEAFFREFYGDKYDVHSAGSDPQDISPHAVQVMAEIEIDISHQTSNALNDYADQEFDFVITLCGDYNACPFFLGGKEYFIQPFEDPSSFTGSEKEKLEIFRQLRNELGDWVQDFYNGINKTKNNKIYKKIDCCGTKKENKDDKESCC